MLNRTAPSLRPALSCPILVSLILGKNPAAYEEILANVLAGRPGYGAGQRSLLQLLRQPFEESPGSLAGGSGP